MEMLTGSPACAGDNNFYQRRRWQPSFPWSSDALVNEAVTGDFIRTVDVAQIDKNSLRHHALQSIEIQRAELLPLGDDHQRRGAFRAGIESLQNVILPMRLLACSMPTGS